MTKIISMLVAFGTLVATRTPLSTAYVDAGPWTEHPNWTLDVAHISFARAYDQFEARALDRDGLTVGFEFEGHVEMPPELREKTPIYPNEKHAARGNYALKLFPLIENSFLANSGSLDWADGYILANGVLFMSVKGDDSIEPPFGRLDVELNSPVLTRSTYRRPLRLFLTGLKDLNFQSTRTSGWHAHVGYPAGEVSSGELILLNDLLHVLQHELFETFRPHYERAGYINPISSARQNYPMSSDLQQADLINNPVVGPAPKVASRLRLAGYGAAVVLAEALKAHGTIEIRLTNASLERGPDELEYATELVAGLIWAIRTHEPKLKSYLVATPAREIRLARIDEILGIQPPRPPGRLAVLRSCWAELSSVGRRSR